MKTSLSILSFIAGLLVTYGIIGWYESGALNNYENIVPIFIGGVFCFLISIYTQRKVRNIKVSFFCSVIFCYLFITGILLLISFFSGTIKEIIPWKFLVIRIGIPILFPLIFLSWVASFINQVKYEKYNVKVLNITRGIRKKAFPAFIIFGITVILAWYCTQNPVVNAYSNAFKNWYIYNYPLYRVSIGSGAYLHTSSPLPYVPKEWLIEKTTYEFLEEHYEQVEDRWYDIKKLMKEHDELWLYRSPPESWKQLAGVEGYTLVRKGKAVAGFITSMN